MEFCFNEVVQQTGNRVTLSIGEAGTLTAFSDIPYAVNTKLNCYMRPERLFLKDRNLQENDNHLEGKVIQTQFFGSRFQYKVQLKNKSILNIQVPSGEKVIWQKGDALTVCVENKNVYLFKP